MLQENNAPQAERQPGKKPVYKQWWFWLIAAVLVVAVASAAGGRKTEKGTPAAAGEGTAAESAASGAAVPTESGKKTEAYELGEGIVRLHTDSIGSQWIRIAVPVRNTGETDLYLSSASLDLENPDGSLARSFTMVSAYPQVLKPGETAYYYENTTTDGTLPEEGLKVVPHPQIKASRVECVRLETSEVEVRNGQYGSVNVVGRVENTTEKEQALVYIVANLFDSDGNFIEQQFTILQNKLQPGEKIGFELTALGSSLSSASEVDRWEIYAFPQQMQF